MNVYKAAANGSLQKTCPPNTLPDRRAPKRHGGEPRHGGQPFTTIGVPFGAGPAERPNGGAVSAALYEERPLGRVAVGVEVFKGLFKKAAARGEQQQMPLGWLEEPPRIVSSYGPPAAAVAAASAAARGEQQQMPLGRWLRSLCPLESLSAGSLSVVETRFRTAGLPTVAAVMDAHLTEPQLIALGLTQVRIRKDVLHAIQGARLQHGGEMPLGRWLRCLGAPSVVETRFRTAGLPTVAAVVDAHLTETQLIALGLTQVRIRKDVLHAIQGARLQRAALSAVRSAADATPVDANATSHANTATRYFSMPSLPASYLLLNSS